MIWLSVLGLEAVTGLCANIFIIFSLVVSGYQEKKLTPYSSILISLCFSNIGYTILMSTNNLISLIWPSLYDVPYVKHFVQYLTVFIITFSSWLTGSLCFFYFIKILQFRSGFLAWVKNKIDIIIPWMILTVEFISLFGSFLYLLAYNQESTKNVTMIKTEVALKDDKLILRFTFVVLMLLSLPIFISILSMAVSAWFLKRHSQYVKRNAGASHAGVNDYQSAIKTMSCLIWFYVLLYAVTLIMGLERFVYQSLGSWICLMLLFSFALVQSSLLIAGNPKLKEAWRQMFVLKIFRQFNYFTECIVNYFK
ncbi:taste receptor type 2 member 39-like [Lithobates pipiens]